MNTKALENVDVELDSVFRKIELEGETIYGEQIDRRVAKRDYLRFLTLHRDFPDATLVPSGLIDLVWHYHILDTRKYMSDCKRVFGRYLHHDPSFGIDEETREANRVGWEETVQLWEEQFGEPLLGEAHRCSTKDCR